MKNETHKASRSRRGSSASHNGDTRPIEVAKGHCLGFQDSTTPPGILTASLSLQVLFPKQLFALEEQ
jgi:hypothetical protein